MNARLHEALGGSCALREAVNGRRTWGALAPLVGWRARLSVCDSVASVVRLVEIRQVNDLPALGVVGKGDV